MKALNDFSKPYPTGNCARVVLSALRKGGVDIYNPTLHAKDLGPILRESGFTPIVDKRSYVPRIGDIVILQPYKGGPSTGHIAMYDGKQWISDFKQKNMYGGSGYELAGANYDVYRPDAVFYSIPQRP